MIDGGSVANVGAGRRINQEKAVVKALGIFVQERNCIRAAYSRTKLGEFMEYGETIVDLVHAGVFARYRWFR